MSETEGMVVGAIPITFPAATAQLDTRRGNLMGFSARETSGAAGATFRLRTGGGVDGQLMVPVHLGPGESTRDWYGPDGVEAKRGLFYELVSGAVEGSAFYLFTE